MNDISLLMCLTAFAFILGFIAGISLRGNSKDDIPRDPLALDVRTPGHKLVAMPTACGTPMRTLKPSSVWPRRSLAAGESSRVPSQRVQSQIERHIA